LLKTCTGSKTKRLDDEKYIKTPDGNLQAQFIYDFNRIKTNGYEVEIPYLIPGWHLPKSIKRIEHNGQKIDLGLPSIPDVLNVVKTLIEKEKELPYMNYEDALIVQTDPTIDCDGLLKVYISLNKPRSKRRKKGMGRFIPGLDLVDGETVVDLATFPSAHCIIVTGESPFRVSIGPRGRRGFGNEDNYGPEMNFLEILAITGRGDFELPDDASDVFPTLFYVADYNAIETENYYDNIESLKRIDSNDGTNNFVQRGALTPAEKVKIEEVRQTTHLFPRFFTSPQFMFGSYNTPAVESDCEAHELAPEVSATISIKKAEKIRY